MYIPLVVFFLIPWQLCLLFYIVKGMCRHIFTVFLALETCLIRIIQNVLIKWILVYMILMLSQFCWTFRCFIYFNAYSCYEVCYVVNWYFCNLWGCFFFLFFLLASGILCRCLVVYISVDRMKYSYSRWWQHWYIGSLYFEWCI